MVRLTLFLLQGNGWPEKHSREQIAPTATVLASRLPPLATDRFSWHGFMARTPFFSAAFSLFVMTSFPPSGMPGLQHSHNSHRAYPLNLG